MKTVVLGPMPPELAQLIEQRRRTGADLHDEVWKGEYHMAPAARPSHGLLDGEVAAILRPVAREHGWFAIGPFNLGDREDYRVPDRGLLRDEPTTTFVPTAALVVEILSPNDETWQKVDFYAARAVGELMIVDAQERSVTLLVLDEAGASYQRADESRLLGLSVEALTAQIVWPSTP